MKNIAVIGAGVSGLAASYLLSRRHRVQLFEKEHRLGGHTNTVIVPTPEGGVALDTGFLVHNHRTYPNLVRLFGELGVASRDSDMSFAVAGRAVTGKAAQAQDDLCRQADRYARLVERTSATLAKQPPVAFSWLRDRKV